MFICLTPAHTNKFKHSHPAALDEELIVRTGTNDSDAFSELYHLTAQAVYGFVLSILKNQHDAEDIMQDTYLKIRQCAHLYQKQGKPMAWILTIARNLSLMRLREINKSAEVCSEPADETSDFSAISDSENRLILQTAFGILDNSERQIVLLHAVSGMKHREIAALLELPLSTVLSKYTRSLKKLKKLIGPAGKEFCSHE